MGPQSTHVIDNPLLSEAMSSTPANENDNQLNSENDNNIIPMLGCSTDEYNQMKED